MDERINPAQRWEDLPERLNKNQSKKEKIECKEDNADNYFGWKNQNSGFRISKTIISV